MEVDQDIESLDIDNWDREVFLVKVPANWAASWAEANSDDELGTIVMPSDPSKPTNFYAPHDPKKPYLLQPRTMPKQMEVISEKGKHITLSGQVKHSYELKDNQSKFGNYVSPVHDTGLTIIGASESRAIQEADRSDTNISMAWAGGRTVDSRGVADKFVERPKDEVLRDLISMFNKQEKYTYEDLNRVLQQPKHVLTAILTEYTTTETEYGKRHFRLRPEFRGN